MIKGTNNIQSIPQSDKPEKNVKQQAKRPLSVQIPAKSAPPSSGESKLPELQWLTKNRQSKITASYGESKSNVVPLSKESQANKAVVGEIVGKGAVGVKALTGKDGKTDENVKEFFGKVIKDKKELKKLVGKGDKSVEGLNEIVASLLGKRREEWGKVFNKKDDLSQMNEQERKEYFKEKYKELDKCEDDEVKQGIIDILENQMTDEDKMNMVYDVDGEYGGDQGSPKERFQTDEDFKNFMRALKPEMKDMQISKFLTDYNKVGCGYMALTNTVFVEYANRPEEFEKTFGFPMYEVDADDNMSYNFDYLVADLYNSSGNIDSGIWASDGKNILNNYLESKEAGVRISTDENKAESVEEAMKTGQVILEQSPVILYNMDENRTERMNVSGAGHAITVTGFTDDGEYIVSSWGQQYIVKPSDFQNLESGYFQHEEIKFE